MKRETLIFDAANKLLKVAHGAGMTNILTNTQDVLKMARRDIFLNPAASGHGKNANRLTVVVTDGNSNIQRDQTVPQAIQLKSTGAEVMVFAVGNFGASEHQEIKDIAEIFLD